MVRIRQYSHMGFNVPHIWAHMYNHVGLNLLQIAVISSAEIIHMFQWLKQFSVDVKQNVNLLDNINKICALIMS